MLVAIAKNDNHTGLKVVRYSDEVDIREFVTVCSDCGAVERVWLIEDRLVTPAQDTLLCHVCGSQKYVTFKRFDRVQGIYHSRRHRR